MVEIDIEEYYGEEEPFIPGQDLELEFELEPEVPITPTPTLPTEEITFELEPEAPEVYNSWLYKFKAIDSITGEEVNAKIIIDGFYSGKYTPANFYLEPNSIYYFKLTKYGYKDAALTISTEELPI